MANGQQNQQTTLKLAPAKIGGMDSVYYNPKLAPIVKQSQQNWKNSKPLPKSYTKNFKFPKLAPKSAIKKKSSMKKNPTYAQISKSIQKTKGY